MGRIYAASKIISYCENYLFDPAQNWPHYHFRERTYSQFAAEELLRRIFNNPDKKPQELAEAYLEELLQMDEAKTSEELRFQISALRDIIPILKGGE